MVVESRVVLPLRVSLAVLFALLLLLQVAWVPAQVRDLVARDPDLAAVRGPLTVGALALLLCTQVVVVATWALLTRVRDDRIFDDASFVWVDAIVWAVAVGWAVLLGLGVLVVPGADDASGPLLLLLVLVGVAVLGLLMVVMRALLRQATALHTDLEGVV